MTIKSIARLARHRYVWWPYPRQQVGGGDKDMTRTCHWSTWISCIQTWEVHGGKTTYVPMEFSFSPTISSVCWPSPIYSASDCVLLKPLSLLSSHKLLEGCTVSVLDILCKALSQEISRSHSRHPGPSSCDSRRWFSIEYEGVLFPLKWSFTFAQRFCFSGLSFARSELPPAQSYR